MSKFTEDAKLLLEYIGGKDNIKAVTHCVTRMRFVLIDEKKADVKKIESLKSAKELLLKQDNSKLLSVMKLVSFIMNLLKLQALMV